MTSPKTAGDARPTSLSLQASRSGVARRLAAAAAAALVFAVGGGTGSLVAVAGAQSSALQQSLGGSTSGASATGPQVPQKAAARTAAGQPNLNAAPDFSGPGISKGVSLIGWAKAGALVIGVLTLTIGIPASKALKEAGNHHASGIRAGVMSVGGATILAGVAGTMLPWLMS